MSGMSEEMRMKELGEEEHCFTQERLSAAPDTRIYVNACS